MNPLDTTPGTSAPEPARVSGRQTGLGRIIVAVYGVFALSASARAAFQIATDFDAAPLAYLLSALAAVVYIVATVALATKRRGGWALSLGAVVFELVGVVVVGTLSFAVPQWFAHPAVWSHYGSGYGYIPLVLPLVGLWWLWRHRPNPQ
ncbi:membrane protein [Zhihengliuella somnathii]